MLTTPPQGDSKKADRDTPTIAALKCAYSLMQQRIISNPNDMMGILLFGTEKSRFQDEFGSSRGLSYPHCYLLTDLDVPGARDIKRLRDLVNDEDEANELLQPSTDPVSMSNVLFCANQIFTTKAPNFSSRRLFLVTDNDTPHNDDKTLRSAAAVRAKDLYDLGVVIELFPVSSPEHVFDRSIFYNVCIAFAQSGVLPLTRDRTSSTAQFQQTQMHLRLLPRLPELRPAVTVLLCYNPCCPTSIRDLPRDAPCSQTWLSRSAQV
jgi:ATP-dependent DNA helicase 2 subunit 1